MCAIVDANVANEVFGDSQTAAGKKFLEWITVGSGVLVVGGKLYDELRVTTFRYQFEQWARQATLANKMRIVDTSRVASREQQIVRGGGYRSDDEHVLALAQASGARLLYSNDRPLQRDFKDAQLIKRPRGKVYSTLLSKEFSREHRSMLSRKDLCNA
jgi:hypothetical protein